MGVLHIERIHLRWNVKTVLHCCAADPKQAIENLHATQERFKGGKLMQDTPRKLRKRNVRKLHRYGAQIGHAHLTQQLIRHLRPEAEGELVHSRQKGLLQAATQLSHVRPNFCKAMETCDLSKVAVHKITFTPASCTDMKAAGKGHYAHQLALLINDPPAHHERQHCTRKALRGHLQTPELSYLLHRTEQYRQLRVHKTVDIMQEPLMSLLVGLLKLHILGGQQC